MCGLGQTLHGEAGTAVIDLAAVDLDDDGAGELHQVLVEEERQAAVGGGRVGAGEFQFDAPFGV